MARTSGVLREKPPPSASAITQWKQAQEALRQNEERFRNVLENSLDMIYRLSLETGTYDYVSPSSRQVIGYSPEELTALGVEQAWSLAHPDDIQRLDENVIQLLTQAPEQDMPHGIEYRFKHKELGYRWVSDTRSVVYDKRNAPVAVVGNLSDITERKQAEEALRESEEKYRDLVNNSNDIVSTADENGNWTFLSPSVTKILGYEPAEMVGRPAFDFILPEDIESTREAHESVVREGRHFWEYENRWISKGGSIITLAWNVVGFRDEGGNIIGTHAVGRDITERKQAEEALRESEERFRALIDNAADIIVIIDCDGVIQYESPAAERVLGFRLDELVGQDGFSFVHPDDLAEATHLFTQVMQNPDATVRTEMRSRHKDGTWHAIEIVGRNLFDNPAVRGIVANFRDISERKQVEEALRRSERQASTAIEAARGFTFNYDIATGKVNWGGAIKEITGYTPEEFAQVDLNGWAEMIHPDDKDRVLSILQEAIQVKDRATAEYRFRTKKGGYVTLSSISLTEQKDGKAVRLVGILQDITERKQAEDTVRESEEKYRDLVNNSNDIVCTVDENGNWTFLSPSVTKILGYEPAEMVGRPVFDFMLPEDIESTREAHESVIREGRNFLEYENRWISKGGSIITLAWNVVGFRDERGNIIGTHAVGRDITERKQAEEELAKYREHLEELVQERTQELRESEERFRSLIENAADVIAIVNVDGTIRYDGPSVERVLGYKPEDRMGQSLFELVHPDDLRHVSEAFARLVQNPGAIEEAEVRYRHKDGSWRYLQAVGQNLLSDPAVAGIVANFRDITERRKAQEKLGRLYKREKKLRQQLEDEMKKRAEFTRALAHELKTPLTPVVMSSELLTSELKDETLLRVARNISRGAANLNSRIDELLDLARGEMGMLQLKPERIDVLPLLQEVIEDVAAMASNKGQSMVSRLPHSLPLISADRTRLRQIVLNLLNNAFKFTPDGGRITLRARQEDGDLVVEVQDTGRGISKEEQQRLFEPYHRVAADRERMAGLGLGLALCKTLVELHGGRIWVESAPGKGSTFGFSLPLERSGK